MPKLVIGLVVLGSQLFFPGLIAADDQLGPDPANLVHLQQLLQRIINISVGLAFIALTIMLVYAGVRFMLSGGDPKNIQSSAQIATYAVVGFVLLAVAWLILLLIRTFTGVDVTQFCLGFPGYPGFIPGAGCE